MEQERPNIFTTSVANIGPGEEIQVEIEYQQTLHYADGTFRLRFPLVVGPRYIPGTQQRPPPTTPSPSGRGDQQHTNPTNPLSPRERAGERESNNIAISANPTNPLSPRERAGERESINPNNDEPLATTPNQITTFSTTGWAQDTDQVPDASRITPPVQHPSQPDLNPVSLHIELNAGFPLASLSSTYHPIHQQAQEGKGIDIRLAQGTVPADRDFELVWTPAPGRAPKAAWFQQHHEGKHYGMLMLMPPVGTDDQYQAPGREVIYVIDTSGSMHGDSIAQARAALKTALARLTPRDRFNIIRFNHATQQLFPTPHPATAAHVQLAQRYVDSLGAQGGTEMLPALQAALRRTEETGLLRQVIFLTDGSVGNEEALFKEIRQRLGSSRLFTVGIGSAPNSFFMRKAAEFGRGTFTYIGDTKEVFEKMQALFRKLDHPALTDIQLETEAGITLEQYPQPIPDLYVGEPLVLVFRSDHAPGTLKVTGKFGNQPWQSKVDLNGGQQDTSLAPEWARRRIAMLMTRHHDANDEASRMQLRQQVIDTALAHHLVSKFTSLVAVDVTPARKADQALKRHAMKTNLPKGWSHKHVFGTSQTATPAQLQMLIGTLLLVIAMLMRWVYQQRAQRRSHALA